MNRKKLFLSISMLISVTVVIELLVFFTLFTEVREDISSNYTREATELVRKEFLDQFIPVQQSSVLLSRWAESGMFDLYNVADLNVKMIPILENLTNVIAISLADSEGSEYFLTRDSLGWRTRSILFSKNKRLVIQRFWTPENQMLSEVLIDSDYDPLTRPWFIGAIDSVDAGELFVTKPYMFMSIGKPGITMSRTWVDTVNSEKINVIGLDLLLSDLINYVIDLEISPNGEAFMVDEQGYFIGQNFTELSDSLSASPLIYGKNDTSSLLIRKAVAEWRNSPLIPDEPFEFKVGNLVCWSEIKPLEEGKIWIGIVIPEKDVIGGIQVKRNWVILIDGIILILSILFAFILAKRYSREKKISATSEMSDGEFIEFFNKLITRGERNTLEFKSTMRMNLNTSKFGKEIEIAWLKSVAAFLNSEGGTLLIGVNDDGEILGLDADQFANEDKILLHFKNLIGQHIGAEFTQYLNPDIRTINGKKVFYLECSPSDKPVYLKTQNEEAFYIRSGPSSVSLSVSQAVNYLESKKKK